MVKRRYIWIIASGVAVLGLGTSGAALAVGQSIPGSNGVIHGCYTRPWGILRVINSSMTRCQRDETSLNWNQTGAAGPEGAIGRTGATGATGPAGPSTAGPAGLDVTVTHSVTIGGGQSIADCPASQPYVLGGGADGVGGAVTASYPVEQNGSAFYNAWLVITDGPGTNAYAICAK